MNESIVSANDFVIENEVLVKYTGTQTTVTIPGNVKKIGKGAFEESQVEEIVFSSQSLQSIEENAFKRCKKLEFIELPEGLVKVGECAFYSCSALKCAYLPSSILVLEENAFDLCASDFYIIGSTNSEAEKLAIIKHFGFKTEKAKTLATFKSANKKRKELATKTFDIFGENISCSNSLPLYDKVIKHYDSIREKFVKDMASYLPNNVDEGVKGDVYKIIEKQIEQSLNSLQNEGVVVEKSHALLAIMSDYQKLCNNFEIVLKKIKLIRETISQNIDGKVVDLKHEINSKVTGLSYGVIGDMGDLLIHDIAEAEAKAEQRAKATAIAKSKLAAYESEQWNEGNRIYKEELKKQLSFICDNAKAIMDSLMNWELTTLSNFGILDLDAMKSLDYEKSVELLNSSVAKGKDERIILALSIKKYPYNILAIGRTICKKYESQGLNDLIEFLNISREVKRCAKEERIKYIADLEKEISSKTSLRLALDFYSELKNDLDDMERRQILSKVTQNITTRVRGLLTPLKQKYILDIRSIVEREMDSIVNKKQWDFLINEGVTPVQISRIPSLKTSNREDLIQCIVSALTKEQSENDSKITNAKNKLKSAKTLSEFEEARKMFVALGGYEDSNNIIAQIDKTILNLKYEAVLAELGKSKGREKLKKAKEDLQKLGSHTPSQEKIEELDILLKRDTVKKTILGICAMVLLSVVILISYFVIYPNSLKDSGDFNDYLVYIDKFNADHFDIPEGTTEIPANAFKDCTLLRSISIPSSVTRIGKDAFAGCSNLTSIYISDLKAYCEIVFENEYSTPLHREYSLSKSTYLYCNGSFVTDLVVPEGATKIGDYAFCYYDALRSVTIPDSVKSIGKTAFREIENLTSVTLGKNVESIGEYAFIHCKSISSISIPESLKNVGRSAFNGCDGIEKVYITDIEKWCLINFEGGSTPLSNEAELYLNGNLVTDLTIPSSIIDVGQVFAGCTSIKSIVVPNSVESIGCGAFSGCDNIQSLTIPFVGASASDDEHDYLAYIFGASSSGYNTNPVPPSLKTVIVTGGTKIGGFARCTNIVNIVLPEGVTDIEKGAFRECKSLTNIILPNSVINIGENAFERCTNLESIILGNNVKTIESGAFHECRNLSSISLPNSLIRIGGSAFENCTKLKSITIPASVKNIDNYAFLDTDITSVTFEIPMDWHCVMDDWYHGREEADVFARELSDPQKAAKYLSSTYVKYDWNRN